jgi:hypothetical protein
MFFNTLEIGDKNIERKYAIKKVYCVGVIRALQLCKKGAKQFFLKYNFLV